MSQLHLFWQQLHNFLIEAGHAADAIAARRITILTFQLVVVEDYLRQLLTPQVFDAYFRQAPTRRVPLDRLRIPPEFSLAAFRFGHSLARPSYDSLGDSQVDTPIAQIFRRGRRLDARHQVIWEGFFGWPRTVGVQNAMQIDPWITPTLAVLPDGQDLTMNLIVRNLEAAQGLPSGATYIDSLLASTNGDALAAQFGLARLHDFGELGEAVDDVIALDALPLWPAILLEAWQQEAHFGLGPLGSLICAEVFRHAIESAEISIYRIAPFDVLAHLGTFGQALKSVMVAHQDQLDGSRSLCMRHLIEVVRHHLTTAPVTPGPNTPRGVGYVHDS